VASGLRKVLAPAIVNGQQLRLLQDNVEQALLPLQNQALANGRQVTVTFPAGANTDLAVNHGLSKSTVNFLVVTPQAAGSVYQSPTRNPNPSQQMILRSSTAGLVTGLYFY
jgi:hypothetical protein